jgi:hypothetical protein
MNILLGDFSAQVGREDIFKLTVGNGGLHETGNDDGVRVIKFVTLKHLMLSTAQCDWIIEFVNTLGLLLMDPESGCNVLMDKRQELSILDVQWFVVADCVTDHYLVVAELQKRPPIRRHATQMLLRNLIT